MKISINFLKKKKYMYDPKCFTVFKKLKTNNINKCLEVHTCVVIKAKKKKLVVEVSWKLMFLVSIKMPPLY